jgi:hypothetical protein
VVGLHALKAFKSVVEDTGCRVEGEILVGCDTWRKPAGRRCPFYRQHVVCEECVSRFSRRTGAVGRRPVNVLPKTRSSGGTIFFGVIVSVMESLEASRPGSFDNESSSACRGL